jgi:hypothetical protein
MQTQTQTLHSFWRIAKFTAVLMAPLLGYTLAYRSVSEAETEAAGKGN